MAITINPSVDVDLQLHNNLSSAIDSTTYTSKSAAITGNYELTKSDFANVSVEGLIGSNGLTSEILQFQQSINQIFGNIDDDVDTLATYFKDDGYDTFKNKKIEIASSNNRVMDNTNTMIDDLNVIVNIYQAKEKSIADNSFHLFYDNLKEG